jgi:hypothetical protein
MLHVDCKGGSVPAPGQSEQFVAFKSLLNYSRMCPRAIRCSGCNDNLTNGNCMAFHTEETQIILIL